MAKGKKTSGQLPEYGEELVESVQQTALVPVEKPEEEKTQAKKTAGKAARKPKKPGLTASIAERSARFVGRIVGLNEEAEEEKKMSGEEGTNLDDLASDIKSIILRDLSAALPQFSNAAAEEAIEKSMAGFEAIVFKLDEGQKRFASDLVQEANLNRKEINRAMKRMTKELSSRMKPKWWETSLKVVTATGAVLTPGILIWQNTRQTKRLANMAATAALEAHRAGAH